MSAVRRAGEIIDDHFHPYVAARKLAEAGLLVTDEVQAVLDAVDTAYRFDVFIDEAYAAFLASRQS